MNELDLEEVQMPSEPKGCILLSERDYTQFVTALDGPKPPTPELREALAEYQRLKAAYPDTNL